MGRSPCCVKEGLNIGAWTSQEDKILKEYIKVHGEGKWRSLPKRAGLKRCGKSCRLRWLNYLRPDIKRGNITDDEEDLIIRLHKLLGNRWSLIAGRLPGRTDNEIKNYWNTNLGKRVEGHPNSSTALKPSTCRSGPKKRLSNNPQALGLPLSQKEGSYVVRTKASRCTKVFFSAELEHTTLQLGIMAMKGPSMTSEDGFQNTRGEPEPTRVATVSREDNSYHDFMMDFEMEDYKFLSEFLQSEFLTPSISDFDMGIVDNLNPKRIATGHSSQLDQSCENAVFGAEETNRDLELGSVASILDPAMDWLQDE